MFYVYYHAYHFKRIGGPGVHHHLTRPLVPLILVFHPPSILKVTPLSLDIISLDILLMEVPDPQVGVTLVVTHRERAAIQSHDVSDRRS